MRQSKAVYFDGAKSIPLDPDAPGYEWAWSVSGSLRETKKLTVEVAYKAVGHLRRAIELRANAIAELPRAWYRLNGEEVEEEDLPFAAGIGDLLYRLETSLCVAGAGYLWKEMTGRRLDSLRWLTPGSIVATPHADETVTFKRTVGTTTKTFTDEEIFYVFLPDPFFEFGPGTPPAATALLNAGVIRSISQYSAAFFERGAIKPQILSVIGGAPMKDDRDRLKKWWNQITGGIRSAFSSEVLLAEVKVAELGSDPKDLAMPDLARQHKEDLATAMGIPYSMLFSDAANYATASQDVRTFYDSTILPDGKLLREALNKRLFTALGYELWFSPEELPAYQEDEEARAGSLASLTSSGMPLDIALDTLGYDLDDADKIRVRLKALIDGGIEYDAAREIILMDLEGDPTPEILKLLELLRPAKKETPPALAPFAGVNNPPADPNAPPPPDNTPPDPPEDPTTKDLGKWERKALKAVSAGRAPSVPFASDDLPRALRAAVEGALLVAEDSADVRRVFKSARAKTVEGFYGSVSMTSVTSSAPPVTVNVTNQIPASAPPVVNVEAPGPGVTVNIPAPVVNVEAPPAVVNVAAPPRILREDQTVTRDAAGNMTGTSTTVTYEDPR